MLARCYIPNIGRLGAALSHANLYPQEIGPITNFWQGESEAQWRNLYWDQSLTLFKISKALRRLSILGYRSCIALSSAAKLLKGLAQEIL